MSTLNFSLNPIVRMPAVRTCGPDSSDEALLEGCLKENRLAQKYLYQRYGGYMLGVCMRYAKNRDEAMEMLNMAFFKVFKSINQYNGNGSLKAWMAKVVLHASIDWVRSQVNYRKRMDFDTEREIPIDNDALQQLAVEDLYEKIQQLPASCRMVFSLYAIEGYTHREIGEMLDISEGTSKWHLSEAKKKLKSILKPELL
jgi:RNA polymerase sigma-70 factor (ECF subfamily)